MYYIPTTLCRALKIDRIYTIHYFEYHKDYTFGGEQHDFWELLYIDRGEVTVTAGEKQFSVSQSQLVVHAPGEFHAIAANGVVAPNTVVISFECNSSSMELLRGKVFYTNEHERQLLGNIVVEAGNAFQNDLGDPMYRKLLVKKEGEPGSQAYGAQQMLLCHLEILLLLLMRKGGHAPKNVASRSDQENLWEERVRQIVAWIGENIDHPFELREICLKAMLNKSTLERVFRQQMGTSIIQYCRLAKVERAKQLLREDSMNITQIADSLGFSSIHYFSRTFKQITGMSPSEYALSVKTIIDHSKLMPEAEGSP